MKSVIYTPAKEILEVEPQSNSNKSMNAASWVRRMPGFLFYPGYDPEVIEAKINKDIFRTSPSRRSCSGWTTTELTVTSHFQTSAACIRLLPSEIVTPGGLHVVRRGSIKTNGLLLLGVGSHVSGETHQFRFSWRSQTSWTLLLR